MKACWVPCLPLLARPAVRSARALTPLSSIKFANSTAISVVTCPIGCVRAGQARRRVSLGWRALVNILPVKIVISETPPYFIDLNAPTLSAYELIVGGMKFWRVWCCHCDRWHDHGAGNGHRIAHC